MIELHVQLQYVIVYTKAAFPLASPVRSFILTERVLRVTDIYRSDSDRLYTDFVTERSLQTDRVL